MAVIRIGASERGGTFWSQAKALARLLERDHALDCEIVESSEASIENARRLEDDEIDFGFMASNWIGRARNGEAPFTRALGVRMAAPANSGAMFFVVRDDSRVATVRDLTGRRVSIGPRGSGMVQHADVVFGALGIDRFEPAHLSFAEGAAAIEAGEVDAQWQCPYPNPVMRGLSERVAVRVLDYDAEDLETVLAATDFYRRAVLAKGTFRGVRRDTPQIAVVNVVATHARADADAVRRLVSTMTRRHEELARANPLFRGLGQLFEPLRTEGTTALEFGGVPLHEGAVAAYREAGRLAPRTGGPSNGS